MATPSYSDTFSQFTSTNKNTEDQLVTAKQLLNLKEYNLCIKLCQIVNDSIVELEKLREKREKRIKEINGILESTKKKIAEEEENERKAKDKYVKYDRTKLETHLELKKELEIELVWFVFAVVEFTSVSQALLMNKIELYDSVESLIELMNWVLICLILQIAVLLVEAWISSRQVLWDLNWNLIGWELNVFNVHQTLKTG